MATETDIRLMRMALALGERGRGNVAPNPAVGCVIARDGIVVGRGWTQAGGRPHAETEALARAGEAASGATAYVTLEPCAHHGETPPCAQALIDAGVARVVIATGDPDPRVDGRGTDMLKAAGVEVETGVLAEEGARANAGFLSRVCQGRPHVTLKIASSADGRIATSSGKSKWITGPEARARGHLLRARSDAILVGSGTVLADDPDLTCRLPGLEDRSPIRVVADARLRISADTRLAQSASATPTWVITAANSDQAHQGALSDLGVELIDVPLASDGGLDPAAMLAELGARGINWLLVEGGATLAASLVRADLVDEIHWFRAGSLIGGDGLAALAGLGTDDPSDAARFCIFRQTLVGDDGWTVYRRVG